MREGRPTILFRADAGGSLGGGHVMRSLSVAGVLRERGAAVVFATRDDRGVFDERIRAEGHSVIRLSGDVPEGSILAGPWPREVQEADAREVAREWGGAFDAVVVDHYHLDHLWERFFSCTVVAVDDLANRRHEVDVLVDQNWYGDETAMRYGSLVPGHSLQLLGPKYAPLQPAYAWTREHKTAERIRDAVRTIMVSFGGSDPTGETAKVVEALTSPVFDGIEVDVVIGSHHVLDERLRRAIDRRAGTTLHVGIPTLAGLLSRADLAVGASGSGTWERMCLGVPALVTTTTGAHSGVTRALAEAGVTVWAGVGGSVGTARYRTLLEEFISSPIPAPPDIVDGLGAQRIAEVILPSGTSGLSLRPARTLDAAMFTGMDVGGPRELPKQLDGPVVWREEAERFRSELSESDQIPLVVTLGKLSVGRVWGKVRSNHLAFRIVLDDVVGGRGLVPRITQLIQQSSWSLDEEGSLRYLGSPAVSSLPDPQSSGGIGKGEILHGEIELPPG